MKKTCVFILMMIIGAFIISAGENNWQISVGGDVLMPRSTDYRDVYGSSVFFPRVSLSLNFTGKWFVQAGYGFLSANGKTVGELMLDTKSKQHFLTLLLGMKNPIGQKIFYQIGAGAAYVPYTEETMGEKVSQSGLGFAFEGGIGTDIAKNIFVMATIGYVYAQDTYTDIEEKKIQIGGFKVGIALGVRF